MRVLNVFLLFFVRSSLFLGRQKKRSWAREDCPGCLDSKAILRDLYWKTPTKVDATEYSYLSGRVRQVIRGLHFKPTGLERTLLGKPMRGWTSFNLPWQYLLNLITHGTGVWKSSSHSMIEEIDGLWGLLRKHCGWKSWGLCTIWWKWNIENVIVLRSGPTLQLMPSRGKKANFALERRALPQWHRHLSYEEG